MQYALDYSAGRPRAAAVRAAGYSGVLRYVGFDPVTRPKCITKAEYADLVAHGIGVGLVYENTAGDALLGRDAGVTAATRARHWADAIGFPTDRPIYLACDTDIVTPAQFAAVLEYLRGAGTVLGPPRVGVYGEADVMERAAAAGVASWFWQTRAWSRGIVSTHAYLLQLVGSVRVDGIDCDRNEIHRPDWGQTGITHQEDEMSAAGEKAILDGVAAIQGALAKVQAGLSLALYGDSRDDKLDKGTHEENLQAIKHAVDGIAATVDALKPAGPVTGPIHLTPSGTITLTPEA